MPKLLISLPTGDISKDLTGDIITIGRTADNKVQIDHHSVSAHHARMTLSNGNYKIKDLDSTNRTCVNGMPVNEAELTGSCILRVGTIECVYKAEKTEAPPANDQLQSQLVELQRQMENLMKARDLISQQNRTLTQERDDAQRDAEVRMEELADAKKLIDRLGGGEPGVQQAQEDSELAGAKKQIESFAKERDALRGERDAAGRERDAIRGEREVAAKERDAAAKERDALLESNNGLKAQVQALTAQLDELQRKFNELQHKATQAVVVAQQHVGVTAQQLAEAHVKEDLDESVEEDEAEEEQQLAVAGAGAVAQRSSVAGIFAGKVLSAAPHLNSWLNRGARRKGAEEPADKTTKITSMPAAVSAAPKPEARNGNHAAAPLALSQPEAKAGAPAAPAGSPLSPTLRLITPPQQPVAHNSNLGSPAVKIGRVSANISPQNPGIRPAWDLLNNMRRTLHYFLRHQDELKVLQEMTDLAHGLTEMAASDILRPIYELAHALEALMADLHASPVNINPSTLRTIGQCIDFIATLINESNLNHIKDVISAKIFAIDDDEGILETIKATMEMVHLDITTSVQASEGLTMLSEKNYDLILLDVGIPEMNGMDICSRVRAMPHHQKTPIVFLTGEATVQNRVQSTLNGGNDLIGKPFSVLELAVKAIVWIFKGQLGLV